MTPDACSRRRASAPAPSSPSMSAALRVSPSSSATLVVETVDRLVLAPHSPRRGARPGREVTASMPKFRRLKRLPLGSDDRPDRPENLPQGIEMLDFTPGFSASPGNRRPRRTVARATPRLRPARSEAGTARADDRPYLPRTCGLSHGPRPEEPAKRASLRTFQRALERPSRRDACGVAPQDEVGAKGGAHLGRYDRPENLPQGVEMLDFTPGISAPPASRRSRRAAARPTPRLRHPRSGAGTARADDRP